MSIRTVTVIGATGTMGANVAGIFASFGDAKVYCVGRDIEKVKKTVSKIVKLCTELVTISLNSFA